MNNAPVGHHRVAGLPSPGVLVTLVLGAVLPLLGLAKVTSGGVPRLLQLLRVVQGLGHCQIRQGCGLSPKSASEREGVADVEVVVWCVWGVGRSSRTDGAGRTEGEREIPMRQRGCKAPISEEEGEGTHQQNDHLPWLSCSSS